MYNTFVDDLRIVKKNIGDRQILSKVTFSLDENAQKLQELKDSISNSFKSIIPHLYKKNPDGLSQDIIDHLLEQKKPNLDVKKYYRIRQEIEFYYRRK